MTQRLFDLTDRTALVTGAGQGMGLGIARALVIQGARVLLNDLFMERAAAAAQTLTAQGLDVVAAPGDITAAETPGRLAALARAGSGPSSLFRPSRGDWARRWA